MKTHAEQLPIEIWISIFHYLEFHDLFRAFINLNNYFNCILASNHLSFYVQLRKFDQFFKQLSFFTPWSISIFNRIIYLKSSTKGQGKYISQFLYCYGKHFLRLKSLTIEVHQQELLPNCIEFIKSYPIEYLSLACIPNKTLLEGILSSPVLCKCRLYFWQSRTNLNNDLNINSNIEILYIRLKNDSNDLIIKFLLFHMPKLKKLQIIGDHIHNYFNPNFDKSFLIFSKLEKLKLIWLRRNMGLDYFEHLLLIIPNIKYISIGIYCYQLNELLLNNLINHWWPNLEKISYIKIILKCHGLSRIINNNEQLIFDNYCRQILGRINTRMNVCSDIKWIEENSKTHTIKITIQKF